MPDDANILDGLGDAIKLGRNREMILAKVSEAVDATVTATELLTDAANALAVASTAAARAAHGTNDAARKWQSVKNELVKITS